MRDAITVEGIITPADAIAGDSDSQGAGVMPGAPPAPHRKALAGKRDQTTGLVTSDFELQYPTADLRRPPIAPVTWTPDDGFVDEEPAEPAAPMTMFRRRTPIRPAGDASESDQRDESDDEFDDDERPTVRFVPAEGPRRIAPPRDLVDLVEQVTGVHVGDAIIDRSPQVSDRAAELGAIAFTEGGTVHLPAELGDIDHPDVRGVAAHELVHVAQHRAREGGLPHEDSPEGVRLEAEARAVQRALAPGAPVVPAFIRASINLPAHRTVGPVGVQRLANEASGEDFSDTDLSDIEPGSGDDRFRWQERESEPAGPWAERRSWDEHFETVNSTTLQGKRDDRHAQLLNEATGGRTATREQILEVRRRLDQEMPYQFGPPFGVQPYPELLPGETTPALGGGGGAAAVGLAAGARSLAATAPVSTAAETGRANEALRHITSRAHEQHRLHGDHEGSMVELFEERFELERTMRWEVLSAKRAAAAEEGAAADHVVTLSDDEIDRIHAAIDIEIPMAVPYPQYLENSHMRLSVAGQLDGPAPAGGARGGAAARAAGATAPAAGHAPGTPGTPATTTPAAGASDAQHALAGILQTAREHAGHAHAGRLSPQELLATYEVRFDVEKTLRREVLMAKVEGAVHAGTEVGIHVHLDQNELDQIHQAIDVQFPIDVEPKSYLDTEDFLSHQITDADVAHFGRQAQQPATPAATAPTPDATAAASPATPAIPGATPATPAPPATTTDTSAAPDAPGGTAPVQTHSAGAVALATGLAGLLGAMHHGDDHAGDELAGTVVDSLTEVDIELLARRLWERLRRELRTELLIDRERAGSLADIR